MAFTLAFCFMPTAIASRFLGACCTSCNNLCNVMNDNWCDNIRMETLKDWRLLWRLTHNSVILHLNMNFGQELLHLHTTPSMLKNILHWLIEGQTIFGHAKGCWNEPQWTKIGCSSLQISNTTSEQGLQVERDYCCMQNNQQEIIGNRLLTKSPIDLKGTCITYFYPMD